MSNRDPMPMNVTPILAVVVLYERGLNEVKSWPQIAKKLDEAGRSAARGSGCFLEHVLIYDNSSQERAKPLNDVPNCTYVHDERNAGTAAAYARAALIACEIGLDWLLLLDQDTLLPDNYFEAAGVALKSAIQTPAAMLPWVFHGSAVVSPAIVTFFGGIKPLVSQKKVQSKFNLTGISSGSLLRVSAFVSCLPFPDYLWLDYVDHWIFANLHLKNNSVISFDAKLQHDLSVFNVKTLSKARLTSILDGEISILAMQGIGAQVAYPFRLVVRVMRYWYIQPDLALHIVAWVFHRILGRT
jgi:hypothetical protein